MIFVFLLLLFLFSLKQGQEKKKLGQDEEEAHNVWRNTVVTLRVDGASLPSRGKPQGLQIMKQIDLTQGEPKAAPRRRDSSFHDVL